MRARSPQDMVLPTASPTSRRLLPRLQCKSISIITIPLTKPFQRTVIKSAITNTTTTLAVPPLAKRDALPVDEFNLVARQATVTPSAIPTYASACSGAARYSSACSCIGATHTTTTVTAVNTTTTTISSTATITKCASSQPTFFLKLANTGSVLDGVKLDGTYYNVDNGFNGSSESGAAYLSLNAQGNLVFEQVELKNDLNEKLIAYTPNTYFSKPLQFLPPPPAYTTNNGFPTLCSIAGGLLKCSHDEGLSEGSIESSYELLQLCPNPDTHQAFLCAGNVIKKGCVVPTKEVVPVCVVS